MGTAGMKKILYLSGPMTGLPWEEVRANFEGAAARWEARGFAVLNPADRFGGMGDLPREVYMRLDIAELIHADGIVLQSGWSESRGCRLEHEIATQLGLEVLYDGGLFG